MRRDQGFTFIEMLIALTIMAFVVTGISLLYLSGYQSYARESDRIEVQENLRIAAARMAFKIKQAKPDTIIPENLDEVPSSHIEFTLSFNDKSSGYRLDKKEGEKKGEIEEKIEGTGGYTWLPVTSRVITKLVFTREGNSITITIEGEKGKSEKVRLSTEVNLRVGESG
ncbi:MAG TPA: prepilin-type N-terminal cleavage/methylation domain-containing protein [Syntrophomonadaceae bacterium]|nr:prepilin-type N-terminal cleavage/methylation domain-containing protein [Syntrophomonadaceae bacterium]